MIAACGAFALTGFPLDDLWHRIFGQDVTLWGPTHLMLIGGGSLAVLGGMVLLAEGIRAVGRDPERDSHPVLIYHLRRGLLVGGFLVALSTFQGEFDFGVPQFRLVLHPILIMLAAAIGLVAARIYLGRGGALLAAVGFIAIRGLIAVMVGGVWGQTLPHFPLYLAEALLVELVFLRSASRRPVAAGALAGVLIGTLGLVAEWGWSHVWMPIPWPASLLPEAAVAGLVAAVAGGAVGGFIGSALSGGLPAQAPSRRPARLGSLDRRAALLGAVALVAVLTWNVPLTEDGPRSATIALRDVQPGADRTVAADIRINPPSAVGDPEFIGVTAWQGGGSVLDPLERTGPGTYRTTEPIPVSGGWKATLRLQQGSSLVAVPIFQPLDRAIPAPETPASPAFTRSFEPDIAVLQRERKQDVAPALSAIAYLTVLAIALALFALIAWALLRLDARGPRRRAEGRTTASRAELV
jgi:hypothetical protein